MKKPNRPVTHELRRKDYQAFVTRPSGLMVSELPADEWDDMFAIISMMEGEDRAAFVMKACQRLES